MSETNEKLFSQKTIEKQQKEKDYAVFIAVGSKINRMLVVISMIINSLFMIMFISRANYGFIIFFINFYIAFSIWVKNRKKNREKKKVK